MGARSVGVGWEVKEGNNLCEKKMCEDYNHRGQLKSQDYINFDETGGIDT